MNKFTIKRMVEHCLEHYPKTRDSDITLMIQVWKSFHNVGDTISVVMLYDLPREDHIKRWRAKIQNEENRFLPSSWEIAKKRNIERAEWERALGYVRVDDSNQYNFA
jgi:hypothetical protein